MGRTERWRLDMRKLLQTIWLVLCAITRSGYRKTLKERRIEMKLKSKILLSVMCLVFLCGCEGKKKWEVLYEGCVKEIVFIPAGWGQHRGYVVKFDDGGEVFGYKSTIEDAPIRSGFCGTLWRSISTWHGGTIYK